MKVLINGLPLFAKRLANDLSEADPNSSFVFLDTYNSILDKIKFFLKLPFCDLVISMNGVTDESGSLNAVLKRKKKLVMQWMGTDISLALDRMEEGTILRKYIDYGYNFVDGPWLKEEVDTLDVNSRLVGFKHLKPTKLADKYEKISVMTYIAGSRADFYGYDKLKNVASSFPDIVFNIYGMDTPKTDSPSNFIFHGWCDEKTYSKGLKQAAVFLRLTEHDGFALSVLEAQAQGCEVIWTYPGERVYQLKENENLEQKLREVIQIIENRGRIPNTFNSEYVLNKYNKANVINGYLHELKRCLD